MLNPVSPVFVMRYFVKKADPGRPERMDEAFKRRIYVCT
jgi:hypothetical protein